MTKLDFYKTLSKILVTGGLVSMLVGVPGLAVETFSNLGEVTDLKTEKAALVKEYSKTAENQAEVKRILAEVDEKIANNDITYWGIITGYCDATSFEEVEKRALKSEEYGEKIAKLNKEIDEKTEGADIATGLVIGGTVGLIAGYITSKKAESLDCDIDKDENILV